MQPTTLRAARKDAKSICTKAECNIVNLSSPEEVKNLSEAQLKRQIKLSQKYYKKHGDNIRRIKAAGKKSHLGVGAPHHIELKMHLMQDSQKRYEKQLRTFKTKNVRKVAHA